MDLTSNRVSITLQHLTDHSLNEERRCVAANNLLVLAKEKAGAKLIIESKGLEKIHKEISADKSSKINLSLVRALSEISRHDAANTIAVLNEINIEFILLLMVHQFTNEESVMAVQYLVQTFINSLTGFDPKKNAPPREIANEDLVTEIIIAVGKRTSSRAMCADGRDTLLELISRNVGQNALNLGSRLIEADCLENLLDVAAEVEDLKFESSMKITRSTKSLVAIALERTYECMDCDKSRETFRERCMDYIKDKLRGGDVENRIRAISVITTLLQGPVEVGNFCISQQGIVELMLVMANSDDDEVQQRIAAEAIIAAASKKEKCTSIASMGSGILKKLYQSPNESIKVRALVGLCKIGSAGGADASFKPFSDESIHKLAKASMTKKEIMPELIELAKFAKQHVPEEHVKDTKEFIEKRVKELASMNITSALVVLCKTESISSREMISRIFNAICEQPDLRGKVVQQGGVKALLSLFTSSNTERGKIIAAQALARIGISMDPRVSFPGQRTIEVIRPLMRLLDVECSALENFEALMALTNLAQIDQSTQRSIMKNAGFSKIEHYIYDDHPMLKRASTQCVTNMITNPDVVKIFEEDNDRVKYWLYMCSEEDRDTIVAAAGGLAMLTGVSKKCCEKILQAKDWEEILMVICSASDLDIQHRALFLVKNIIFVDKALAEKIINTKLFNVLMAITLPEVENIEGNIKNLAKDILQKCQSYGLIKPADN
uniref:UNC-45/Cro1/She4 central domain-containing protein n=1 Tax=Tetranychus urticae TaxID=32264 RepID=T1KZA5_TETUR